MKKITIILLGLISVVYGQTIKVSPGITVLAPSDTINRYIRPIAGINMTITGIFPNLTFNATAASTTTSEQVITAIAAQTAFTFTSVPASYSDYMIIVNGGVGASTTAFTTSGNIVTTTLPLDAGDVVILRRIK